MALFLSIDYSPDNSEIADDGKVRPWKGPDLWYTNASIFLWPDQVRARVDDDNVVRVRVSNNGTEPIPGVVVEAWVANPQVGVMSPASALMRFISEPKTVQPGYGLGSVNDEHIFSCLNNGQTWRPDETVLANTNGGHLCLFANVFQDPNFADPPLEGEPIPAGGSFDPAGDARQGQRNITLVRVPQQDVRERHSARVHFEVSPPPLDQLLVSLEVTEPPVDEFLSPSDLYALSALPEVTVPDEGPRVGELTFRTGTRIEPLTFPRTAMEFALDAPGFALNRMLPMENKRGMTPSFMDVQIDPDAAVGSAHVFDITQNSADGQIGAGLRVIVLVTE